MIIHPDKNIDNKEKAQVAFEALSKAYKWVTYVHARGELHKLEFS